MSGFANSVVGGADTLIRRAIKSPNYSAGISGWSINKDGSAEFNDVTTRGSLLVSDGTNEIEIQVDPASNDPWIRFNPDAGAFDDGYIQATDLGLGTQAALSIISPVPSGGAANPSGISVTSSTSAGGDGNIALNTDLVQIGAAHIDLSGLQDDPTWTPTWSSAANPQPSLGNGIWNNAWIDLGAFAWFTMELTMGNTTTFGTGVWSFTLPFTPYGGKTQVVAATAIDATGARWAVNAQLNVNGVAVITIGTGGTIDPTNPFVWTTNDILRITGFVRK